MTREEAHRILSNGLVNAPSEHEWCMAFRMAIKALEQEPCETIKEISKDYKYDTETEKFLVYRHMYTGHEIHIEKPVPRYRLEQETMLDKIRAEIEQEYTIFRNKSDMWSERACGLGMALDIIDKYLKEVEE